MVLSNNMEFVLWDYLRDPQSLRAGLRSLDLPGGIFSKPPEHDADHGEADECNNCGGIAFEVAHQTAVATNPCESLSTIQRFGRTSNPAPSNRLTICSVQARVRHTVDAILCPAYLP